MSPQNFYCNPETKAQETVLQKYTPNPVKESVIK